VNGPPVDPGVGCNGHAGRVKRVSLGIDTTNPCTWQPLTMHVSCHLVADDRYRGHATARPSVASAGPSCVCTRNSVRAAFSRDAHQSLKLAAFQLENSASELRIAFQHRIERNPPVPPEHGCHRLQPRPSCSLRRCDSAPPAHRVPDPAHHLLQPPPIAIPVMHQRAPRSAATTHGRRHQPR